VASRLVAWTPIIAFLALAYSCIIAMEKRVCTAMAPILATSVGEAIHREVKIGRIDFFSHIGKITLRDVSVSNHAHFSDDKGSPLISAQSVIVNLNRQMLSSNMSECIRGVKDVEIDGAVGSVQRLPLGKWNFSDLIPKKSMPDFLANISIRNASLTYSDFSNGKASASQLVSVGRLYGDLKFRSQRLITLDLKGVNHTGLFDAASLNASFLRNDAGDSSKTKGYFFRLTISKVSAAYAVANFLPNLSSQLKINSGKADLDATIQDVGNTANQPADIQGHARVFDGSCIDRSRAVLKSPMEHVCGDFEFTQDQTSLNLSGEICGMPVTAKGIVHDLPRAQINVQIEAPQVFLSRLPTAFTSAVDTTGLLDAPAAGSISISAAGSLDNPNVIATASLPTFTAQGYTFDNVNAAVNWNRGVFSISSITMQERASGAKAAITGQYGSGLSMTGELDCDDLSKLAIHGSIAKRVGRVTGAAKAHFTISAPFERRASTAGKLSIGSLNISTEFAASRMTVRGFALGSVYGGVDWKQGVGFTIPKIRINDSYGGIGLVTGHITGVKGLGMQCNLNVVASRVNIGEIMRVAGGADVSGTGYFQGVVTGSFERPVVSGSISCINGWIAGNDIELANGMAQWKNDTVSISSLTVHSGSALGQIRGSVSNIQSNNPRFNLHADISKEQLSRLAHLLATESTLKSQMAISSFGKEVEGLADISIDVTGNLRAPIVRGSISMEQAASSTWRIHNLEAQFGYSGQKLIVERAQIMWEGAQIQLAGEFDLTAQSLRFSFNGNNLDISRISRFFGSSPIATGTVSIAGVVSGLLSDPQVTAQIVTDKIDVAAFSIASVRAAFHYEHGVVSSLGEPVDIEINGAKYVVSGYTVNTKDKSFRLNASVFGEKLSSIIQKLSESKEKLNPIIPQLYTLIDKAPLRLDAAINRLDLTVSGTVSDPRVILKADVSGFRYGFDLPLSVKADMDINRTSCVVREFIAQNGPSRMTLKGSANVGGDVDAELRASHVSLAMLNSFLPKDAALGGVVEDLTVMARGRLSSPDVEASFLLDAPSSGSIAFDRLDSGRIEISGNQIKFDKLTATKYDKTGSEAPMAYTASLWGSLPIRWQSRAGIPVPSIPIDQPVDLHASVPRQDLSAIQLFAPGMADGAFGGKFAAALDLGGTLAQRKAVGQVSIQNGQYTPNGFGTGLTAINAVINFNGSTATLVNASAQSKIRGGGVMTASGSMSISEAEASLGSFQRSSLIESLLGGVQLDLKVHAKDFMINEPKLAAFGNAKCFGVVNGDFTLTKNLLLPLVSGAVSVDHTVVTLPSNLFESVAVQKPRLITPSFDISANMKPGAKIETAQMKLSDTKGTFKLTGNLDRPRARGTIIINKGVFVLPTARFRVTPGGSLDVAYAPQSIGDRNAMTINVNMVATSSVSISQRSLSSRQQSPSVGFDATPSIMGSYSGYDRFLITATIRGMLNSDGSGLNLQFESDPALSRGQILSALGGQEVQDIGSGDVNTGMSSLVARVLSNRLGSSFFDNLYNSSGLDINMDINPGQPLDVNFTQRLGSRFEASFMRLDSSRNSGAVASTLNPPQYLIILGYNLNGRMRLSVSTDDQSNFAAGLEGVFRF